MMSSILNHLTIVLLGHSGVGKSATGNTILGKNAFESRRSLRSVTKEIKEVAGSVCERQVSVVDTPGILNQGSERKIQDYCQNVQDPCLFLVVVKLDRFTEEHQKAVEAALRVVGDQRRDKTYLLFTGGDALDQSLDDFIKEDDESQLPQLVQQFQGHHVVFKNKDGGLQQVRELLTFSGHLEVVSGGPEQRNVVLLGMCGAGKSSTGNTLLGSEKFRAGMSLESVTTHCECPTAEVEGRRLTVVDTPGLNDCIVAAAEVADRILKAVEATGSEIHAFVIVVKLDRVSEAERQLLRELPKVFGEDAARYTMVLFTYGDKLQGKPIGDRINASPFASQLVRMCAQRYCVFANNQSRDRSQVEEFLKTVEEIVTANRGKPCRIVQPRSDTKIKVFSKLIENYRQLEVVPGVRVQRNVVLLGMCGAGKSSTGNTLLGSEKFEADPGFESVTAHCGSKSAVVGGRKLTIMDTPGLTDHKVPAYVVADGILEEMKKTGPEIHAFVIVMKLDRVSEAERKLIHGLPEVFGKEAAQYTMVLFTYGDQLQGKPIGKKISDSTFISQLVSMCAQRYCVFANNQSRDRSQVEEFLQKVEEIVTANNGEPCRNVKLRTFDQIRAELIKLIEKIRSWIKKHNSSKSSIPYNTLV